MLGYTYSETQSNDAAVTRAAVMRLYGGTVFLFRALEVPAPGRADGVLVNADAITGDTTNSRVHSGPVEPSNAASGKPEPEIHLSMRHLAQATRKRITAPISEEAESHSLATNIDAEHTHGIEAVPKLTNPPPEPGSLARFAPNGKYTEWITNIHVQKHCLGQSFSIHVFLGAVPAAPADLTLSPSKVGTFCAFAGGTESAGGDADADGGCEKCKTDKAAELKITGVVLLTLPLAKAVVAGAIPDLSQDVVKAYLMENLSWRAARMDGTVVELDQVADLRVSVTSREVTLPEMLDEFPVYGVAVVHADIIQGKAGGYAEGDVH